eukprot:1973941-Prymnesium_polylepis.2
MAVGALLRANVWARLPTSRDDQTQLVWRLVIVDARAEGDGDRDVVDDRAQILAEEGDDVEEPLPDNQLPTQFDECCKAVAKRHALWRAVGAHGCGLAALHQRHVQRSEITFGSLSPCPQAGDR